MINKSRNHNPTILTAYYNASNSNIIQGKMQC